MRLSLTLGLLAVLPTVGCSSYQIARDVKLLSLTSEPKAKEISYGNIQGKSCQWYVLSYPLGEKPSVRVAFENAAKQKDGGAIPLPSTQQTQNAPVLSVLRNVSTDRSFFDFYLAARDCITVSGLGAL